MTETARKLIPLGDPGAAVCDGDVCAVPATPPGGTLDTTDESTTNPATDAAG